jgi:hypothetical protein
MNGITLSIRDRQRLVDELARCFARLGRSAHSVSNLLLQVGLPRDLVFTLPLSGTPYPDAISVITSLEQIGRLINRPEYYALGALVDYLLNTAVDLEGKVFLSNLLAHYRLVLSSDYINQLHVDYVIPVVVHRDTIHHLLIR